MGNDEALLEAKQSQLKLLIKYWDIKKLKKAKKLSVPSSEIWNIKCLSIWRYMLKKDRTKLLFTAGFEIASSDIWIAGFCISKMRDIISSLVLSESL